MIPRNNILLIEDEQILGEIIKESLESRGYEVHHYVRGQEGLKAFFHKKPELVLLDVMMQDADGFELAKQIRRTDKQTPILFLTAKSMPHHVVEGFESGGNDYLKKPFSLEELLIRIKVLLSPERLLLPETEEQEDKVAIGQYLFFPNRQVLQLAAVNKKLSSKEAELLRLLYRSRNHVIERKTLLLKLWKDDSLSGSRSLDVYITRLRNLLMADTSVQIINYRGVGYKLIF